jgi:hypothetical protein
LAPQRSSSGFLSFAFLANSEDSVRW